MALSGSARRRGFWLTVALSAVGLWLPAGGQSPKPAGATSDGTVRGKTASPVLDRKVDFAAEIFPLFQDRCLGCHGPEQQMGEYRLDAKSTALRGGVSGPNILPGRGAESPLYQRIAGVGDRNPMPMVGERLTAERVALVGAWIDQGAEWPDAVGVQAAGVAKHWAYIKPVRPTAPEVQKERWVRNPIDNFVLARLEKQGLDPAPEASKETLARRLSLDLLGLPPSIAELDRFLADNRPEAYEEFVDGLLASARFGEHWAKSWLDLARYADTNGYESDEPRTMWAYRDWVIDAFNRNLPFDQFTIEQLAGDLLPDPTENQFIATGFHRNTMINNEAGSKDDEFYDAAVKDRVDTTATVWLGSTFGCAQCHDHKYDPFKQKEYYQLYAIFNNTADSGIELSEELPVFKGDKRELERREREVARVKKVLDTHTPELAASQEKWEQRIQPRLSALANAWRPLAPTKITSSAGVEFSNLADGSVLVSGEVPDGDTYEITFRSDLRNISALRVEALLHKNLPEGGPGLGEKGAIFLTGIEAEVWTDEQLARQAKNPLRWGNWHTIGPWRVKSRADAFATSFPPETNYDLLAVYDDSGLAWGERKDWKDGRVHYFRGEHCASYAYRTVEVEEQTTILLSLGSHKGIEVWLNGKKVLSKDPTRPIAPDQEMLRLKLERGSNQILLKVTNDTGPSGFYFRPYVGVEEETRIPFARAEADHFGWLTREVPGLLDGDPKSGWEFDPEGDLRRQPPQVVLLAREPFGSAGTVILTLRLHHDSGEKRRLVGRFRISATTIDPDDAALLVETPRRIQEVLSVPPSHRGEEQTRHIEAHYRSIAVELAETRAAYRRLTADLEEFRAKHTTTTLVMQELPEARETHRQNRGNFLDLAESVYPGIPRILGSLGPGQDSNRLDFARWLVSEDNPLAARVRVNQIVQSIFGRGLVPTPEDFGTQGDPPSHPELLDWLATEYMRLGWNTKPLIKTIAMSATYRQSSVAKAEKLDKDPDNVLFSRGARYRVPGEAVRDIALAASGLLSDKIGGPSVYPPQPKDILADHFIEGGFRLWPESEGEDRYRRGLYTFYKRTSVYPTFMTFDAPDRTVCAVQRSRSNTPLQALNTLNDPVFVEAAAGLAQRMMREVDGDLRDRIEHGCRLVLARRPSAEESRTLVDFHDRLASKYRDSEDAAGKFVANAFHRPAPAIEPTRLAPMIMVANVLLNLDEAITRE